ncbi:nitroreductase family protein [Clostridium estertheticum]|uniref:hypothetical protein n=1 Tax=Clostridium estertheticum TaxID=238834 RepID=UPI002DD43718|nr:hypothetical protein [Clostridium estertheticum]
MFKLFYTYISDKYLCLMLSIPHLKEWAFRTIYCNQQGISYIIVEDKKILKKATEVVIEWMESQGENPLHWSFPYHIRAYRETGIDQILRDAPNLILAMAPKEMKNGRENTIFSFAYLDLITCVKSLY